MTAWMTGIAAAAFLTAAAVSAQAQTCQIRQVEGPGVERCLHQASFRSGPTAPPRGAMQHQGGGQHGMQHGHHHGGGIVFGGPSYVYGSPSIEPDYLVVPTPRYIVNQGPVLGGPGFDPPPYVVYREVYDYQDAAVSGWAPALRDGYYYGYDGGPYAHPMRHTYDGALMLPPAIIKLAPRRGVYDMRPHRPIRKGKMIQARVR
ncbi:MAG: hypothetical protein EPO23_04260 [Xanthobacteraceae bacterium]|nr:MAG: hypothetical protein EPO23_04260 [Xanthobacteraceae bacterium]